MGWSRAEEEACRSIGDGGLVASSVRGRLLLLLLLCMLVVATAKHTAAACLTTATASQGQWAAASSTFQVVAVSPLYTLCYFVISAGKRIS